jgi:hypothetical protein
VSNRRTVLLGYLSTLMAAYGPPRLGWATPAITGATISGVTREPDTLANLIAATPFGGTLVLPAGTWSGTAPIRTACTIKGAGAGQTIIDATGVSLTRGKGIFVPMVAGAAFADMTLKGAAVRDLNGAGIREDGPGLDWNAMNVEFTGNQDGVLTFASNVTLNNCSFHDNGAHDGYSHEMYFNGSPTTKVTLNSVTSIAGASSTHALKSRAGTTRVVGGSYIGNPGGGTDGVGGSVLNFPNCGEVTLTGTMLTIGARSRNFVFISYGTENANNAAVGTMLTLINVHLVDRSGTGGVILNGRALPGARLIIGPGCVYDGIRPPRFQGWASIRGSFTASGAAVR